jgi:predicted NUDIX family NTP pyrophosphohydrolase
VVNVGRAQSNTVSAVAKTSAGILLYRNGAESPEVLLVHPGGPFWAKKDEGVWSIPKGELEEGEEPRACALRELEEEIGSSLGLTVERLAELGEVRQKSGKLVLGWAAEADFDPTTLRSNTFAMEWPPRSGREHEFPEVDRAEWFAPEQARRKINPAQVAFIDRLLALRAQPLSRRS